MKTALLKKKMLGILAVLLVCVMAFVFIAQIDWKKVFAEDYSADYMQLSDQNIKTMEN